MHNAKPLLSGTQQTKLLLASLLALLSGCVTAPTVQPQVQCPKPPEILNREPLGQSYTDRMQLFLSGKLPEPIDSKTPLKSVTPTLTQPKPLGLRFSNPKSD